MYQYTFDRYGSVHIGSQAVKNEGKEGIKGDFQSFNWSKQGRGYGGSFKQMTQEWNKDTGLGAVKSLSYWDI